ncbi:hypothetical protein QLQ12_05685 [Actinoplanes sp. NEAU-A12]|uniref:Pentapeptide repeat-containing protein n=1 Tax=Actinoplanes sandaracinus TaxID=3045177 RepID=A0ABT6WEF8_9ACTN|nr:hypothetical protein [Actinoplanes sandaracinus]MDI6098093.1 hypothetical protein [Actinoplanes sandaracinus]
MTAIPVADFTPADFAVADFTVADFAIADLTAAGFFADGFVESTWPDAVLATADVPACLPTVPVPDDPPVEPLPASDIDVAARPFTEARVVSRSVAVRDETIRPAPVLVAATARAAGFLGATASTVALPPTRWAATLPLRAWFAADALAEGATLFAASLATAATALELAALELAVLEPATVVPVDPAVAAFAVAIRPPAFAATARPAVGFTPDGPDPARWTTGRWAACFAPAEPALAAVLTLVGAAALAAVPGLAPVILATGVTVCCLPGVAFGAACLLLDPR